MTAGGKFKDGWFAQLCLKDEFGAAPYANGKNTVHISARLANGELIEAFNTVLKMD